MIRDHYAVLGVSPSSEDVVIHAAYRALMRQYHPDRNPSVHAAQRVREITAAYEVLRDPDRRAEYNAQRRAERDPPPPPRRRFGTKWMTLAAAGVVGAAAILLVAGLPLGEQEQPDRLPDVPSPPAAVAGSDLGADCASDSAADLIKREIFRRAARARGGEGAAFERIARYSLLRLDSAAGAEGDAAGMIGCSASAALDLPPGVAAAGGRRTVTADLAYSLSIASDSPRLIALTGAEDVVGVLSRLASVAPPVEEETIASQVPEAEPLPPAPPAEQVAPAAPAAAAERRQARQQPVRAEQREGADPPAPRANASFNCRFARTRGEIAVCKSDNLAALDRHQAVLYSQSWALADAERRERLLSTRAAFVARRDSCRTDACVRTAYVERLREISDIMARR